MPSPRALFAFAERRTYLLIVAAALLLVPVAHAAAADITDLTQQLAGDKPAAQRTDQERTEAYTAVLQSLLADLATEDAGKRSAAQSTLERIAFHASRPDAESERSACAGAIAAQFANDTPVLAKFWLIRQLERIGRAESVASLARLLEDADPSVRDCARRALAKNPAPESAEPLRKTLAAADTATWQIALINAIASRRDPADVTLIAKYAASDNDRLCIASLRGLATIGDKAGIEALLALMQKGSPQVRQAATDCFITLANHLGDNGDKINAVAMYGTILNLMPTASAPRSAAIIGLGRFGAGAFPMLFEAAGDSDFRVRGAVTQALAASSDKNVVDEIAKRFAGASPQAKVVFLRALSARRDKSSLGIFLVAADDADLDVRATAIRGFVSVGDAQAIPVVLKSATTDGEVQAAARFALDQMSSPDINSALLASVKDADGRTKVELARAFGARRVYDATPLLIQSAADADPAVRRESIRTLGLLVDAKTMPDLITIMAGAPKDDRDPAIDAVTNAAKRLPDEVRADAVVAALPAAQPEARTRLLAVAGRIGGSKALAATRETLADPNADVHSATVRTLAAWPDAEAAEDVLKLATGTEPEQQQIIALQGYIRLVGLASNRPAPDTIKMYMQAMSAAKRPDEKRRVLAGLGQVRHIAALQAVTPYLDDPALVAEAAQAAVRIGREIVNDNPESVRAAMQKVLEISKNTDIQKQAKETLDRAAQKLNEAKAKN
jgi:HEAT repeat protein